MACLGPLSQRFENDELLIDDYLTEGGKMLNFQEKPAKKSLKWDPGHCSSRVLIEAVMIIQICANNQTWHTIKTQM